MNSIVIVYDVTESRLPAIEPAGRGADRDAGRSVGVRRRPRHGELPGATPAGARPADDRTGETVCGFLHLTTRQSILHDRPTGLIDELMVVAREFRDKGIGRLLIDAAFGRCRDLGCCEVEVGAESQPAGAAILPHQDLSDEGVLFDCTAPARPARQDVNEPRTGVVQLGSNHLSWISV